MVVRQSGPSFYFQPKEASRVLKITKNDLKDVIVKMGGETGKKSSGYL